MVPGSIRDGYSTSSGEDFSVGKWKTHITNLVHPLSHSSVWVKLEGTVTTRSIWNGKAFLEEIEAGNVSENFKGITLFLYNRKAGQWSQTFTDLS